MKKRIIVTTLFISLFAHPCLYAQTPIHILPTKTYVDTKVHEHRIKQIITDNVDVSAYREIRVQLIVNNKQQPDHLLLYLLSHQYHGVEMMRVEVDRRLHVLNVKKRYVPELMDRQEQPGVSWQEAVCPDDSIEFIAFAPNDMELEQTITKGVAQHAELHNLKTTRLLEADATRTNYLNYMKCPKLIGNFYDGDANPYLITTVDGFLTHEDIEAALQFNYKVTNIWLACQAYNDPMKSTMLDMAKSQKYAAGINDLLVGPSDRAAACTMKAAIRGKAMSASFDSCYNKFDVREDHWGFGGDGSDFLGV